jgi:hypothetical protein
MKRLVLILIGAGAMVLPSAAPAGCWATVGLSSMPDGTHAGEAWNVAITVKQHGRTLLANARPTVTIARRGASERVFQARKTARKGVYRASVVFPTAGAWTFTVFDGFLPRCGRDHTYAPATILSEASAG